MRKQQEAMQAMLFKLMQQQAEKEADPAQHKETVKSSETQEDVLDEKTTEKVTISSSFARSNEGLFTLPGNKEEVKHKPINERVEQTTNKEFALTEKDQKEQASITSLTN